MNILDTSRIREALGYKKNDKGIPIKIVKKNKKIDHLQLLLDETSKSLTTTYKKTGHKTHYQHNRNHKKPHIHSILPIISLQQQQQD